MCHFLLHQSSFFTSLKMENGTSMPLCLKVLNREHLFVPDYSIGTSMMILARQTCRLHDYKVNDVLYCLIDHKPSLNIVFMGDSRTRQQFLNFIRVNNFNNSNYFILNYKYVTVDSRL